MINEPFLDFSVINRKSSESSNIVPKDQHVSSNRLILPLPNHKHVKQEVIETLSLVQEFINKDEKMT